jgi:hypothetical protein
MEITKKMFNSLKQLDRIEFRQKRGILIENNEGGCFVSSIIFLALSFIISSLFIGLCWGGSMMIKFMTAFAGYSSLFGVILALALLVDVYNLIRFKKDFKELEQDYFKVETKNGNKRK